MRPLKMFIPVIATVLFVSCAFFKKSPQLFENLTQNHQTQNKIFIYNDSVDSILLKPDKICLYQMKGLIQTDSVEKACDSIFNYKIQKTDGIISKDMQQILLFIIEDKKQYQKDYEPIRQPFHPNITIEFIQGEKKIYYFISLGTNEVAIADERRNFQFYLFKTPNLLIRWLNKIFPSDEYYNNLLNNKLS